MASPSGLSIYAKKKIDLKKCIICQNVKDNKGNTKLTSTENGRNKLFKWSESISDNKFDDVEDKENIHYHANTCYQRYIRSAEREKRRQEETEIGNVNVDMDDNVNEEDASCNPRPKRRKSEDKTLSCVICNQAKSKGDKILYRIGGDKRAKELLAASRYFKDDVFTRCSLLNKPGDVFAADVLYHKNCLSSYTLKFKRELQVLISFSHTTCHSFVLHIQ